jgi:hypothetical protein
VPRGAHASKNNSVRASRARPRACPVGPRRFEHAALDWIADGPLRDCVREHTSATLAIAAGAGYVLGGGLTARAARLLVGIGGRIAVEALMRWAIVGTPEAEILDFD